MLKTRTTLCFAVALLTMSGRAYAHNLLDNGSFEDWWTGADGYTTYTGTGGGPSASLDWEFENGNYGTTTTQEVAPPPGPGGSGQYCLYITTTAAYCGIDQGLYQDPYVASASGWVYVVSGSVAISLGDVLGHQYTIGETAETGKWIFFGENLNAMNVGTFSIYSLSPYTEFYVDTVDADTNPLPTPEPASLLGLGLGAFALLRRRRKV